MIIAQSSLLSLIADGHIIRGLSDRELKTPEGVGFDLRLSQLHSLGETGGSLRVDTRKTSSAIEKHSDLSRMYYIYPDEYCLATTIETFSLPSDIMCTFFPRSTLFRSGIVFQSSIIPPGYEGPATFSLYNAGVTPFEMEVGARFAHVVFSQIAGESQPYRGQWQGGRLVQPDHEKQI
jgi:deoxycytidine triphosphate deaminase